VRYYYNNKIYLPNEQDMPIHSKNLLRWCYFFIKPYAAVFWGFLGFRAIRYTIMSLFPLLTGIVINAFSDGSAYENPVAFITKISFFLLIYFLASISVYFQAAENAMMDRITRGLTLFSLQHLNTLPLSWHEEQGSGGKMQRIMTARKSLNGLHQIYKWAIVPFVGIFIGVMISIITVDAPFYYVGIFILFLASYVTIAVKTGSDIPGLHNEHNKLLERLNSGVYEFVAAIRTVKSFNMHKHIENRAHSLEGEGHRIYQNISHRVFMKWIFLNGTACFWLFVIIAIAIYNIYQGTMNAGSFATVFFLAYNFWMTLENCIVMQDQYYQDSNGFMRLTETLTTASQKIDIEPLKDINKDWDRITINQMGFLYRDDKYALKDIDIIIPRGQKIALVGRSGAGKSTFVKLFMKQMLPNKGSIKCDQTDIRHIPSCQWLSEMGFVPQDVELFNLTIRDNIMLDRAEECDEEFYQQILKQSALDQFINTLPMGDETLIGERGILLSGGQRQRLGIARALIRNAPIIIFDEATSALDSLSEQSIQEAIDTSFTDKTLIVIAHRLSTIRNVDMIYVFEDGKIIERGNFDELVKSKGAFAKLWEMQTSSFTGNNI
jgi:ABC-type multidrug transport system fused ATPase/permease subunit